MADARQRVLWAPFSALMALLANCHRNPARQRPLKPADFDPFQPPRPPMKISMRAVQDIFAPRPR